MVWVSKVALWVLMVLLGCKALRLGVWASGFRVSRPQASIHSALMKVEVALAYVPMNLHFYSRHLGFLLGWSVAVTSKRRLRFRSSPSFCLLDTFRDLD